MLDFLIIGGGISGLTFGHLLLQKGITNFAIIEKENVAGGLCRTQMVDGVPIDTGGGHFLYTKYPRVYDFIFSKIPETAFNKVERVSKIAIEGQLIDYPIESNLWQLPEKQCLEYLLSLIAGQQLPCSPSDSYKQYLYRSLGKEIAEKYLIPYNQKIWGVDVSEMSSQWLNKIPCLDLRKVLLTILTKKSDSSLFPSHPCFYYPKVGGFQTMVDAFVPGVSTQLRLNYEAKTLVQDDKSWILDGVIRAKRVINTIPWSAFHEFATVPQILKEDLKKLQYNTLVVSCKKEVLDPKEDWHWLYQADLNCDHHRVFNVHNFALGSKPTRFYETNIKRFNKFAEDLVFHYINQYAYPIPIQGKEQAIANVLKYYESKNLYGLGRWGQWEYFNSDVCIEQAFCLSEKLF